MKQRFYILLIFAACVAFTAPESAAQTELPKVEILGKKYYYYTSKKGDSLYGICKKLGWKESVVRELNPAAVTSLKKDMKIYYPTGDAMPEPLDETKVLKNDGPGSIVHQVKKGETVYSISRLYGIPVEQIYASHPSARTGLKAGETITIEQTPDDTAYYFYQVKNGDTLYAVAKEYRTTVEDIMYLNPGVSEQNFRSGTTIKIQPGSNADRVKREQVEEEQLSGFGTYKVKKGDTWESVAEKTGTDVEELKSANPGSELKKNEQMAVPATQTVTVVKEIEEIDPREETSEGREELYNEINKIDETLGPDRVNALILLTEPTSARDLDFTRGVLLAVDKLKTSGLQINLNVIKGTVPADVPDSILNTVNLIISTCDGELPAALTDFGLENKTEIINVFDVKSEAYVNNPFIVQLLPPSSYFNAAVSDYVKSEHGNRTLLLVGGIDQADQIASEIQDLFVHKKHISVEDLANYVFDPEGEYMVYSYATHKDDVTSLLSALEAAKEESPGADIVVMGRPNWVTMTESLKTRFGEQGVIVPSRFYFDRDDVKAEGFLKDFQKMFDREPTPSFPLYSVTGYDVASCFLPAAARNGGDFNVGINDYRGLQNDIAIERASNWAGFLNPASYVLKFTPAGVEKIMVR